MKPIRERLSDLLAQSRRRKDPFPAGGLSALAEELGCSRQWVQQLMHRDHPELLKRLVPSRRTLCERCGGDMQW